MAHSTKDAVVALRSIEGTWTHVGVDVGSEIYHEGLKLDWDMWGPSTASFTLRRQPRVQWPDIKAFTDVEVVIDGVQVWKGRVKDTPVREGAEFAIEVNCEGMQYHLDDDVYIPYYVHNRISDWKDASSHPNAQLGNAGARIPAATKCSIEGGAITLAFPRALTYEAFCQCIAYIDLGPDTSIRAKTVVATVQGSNTHGEFQLLCRGATSIPNGQVGSGENYFTVANGAGTVTTSGTTTNSYRYVLLMCENNALLGYGDADSWFRITNVKVFVDSAYMSSNLSTLKASTVVQAAAAKAPLLDLSDTSLVTTTSLSIPDFASLDNKTPREVINAANAYHNYLTKVDERARFVFKPLPSAPSVEVGSWTPLEGTNASQNSAEETYSRAIVEGQDPAGNKVQVSCEQGGAPGAIWTDAPGLAFTNPSFDTNTTGWTAQLGSSIARTTTVGEYTTGPAGLSITGSTPGVTGTLTGTFIANTTYIVRFDFRGAGGISSLGFRATCGFGAASGGDRATIITPSTSGAFQKLEIAWTPRANTASATVTIQSIGNSFVDSFELFQAVPNLPQRRGFKRTKVLSLSSVVDAEGTINSAIGNAFIANHRFAQFKGSYSIAGDAREVLSGATVPPERLGMRTGELLRLSDRVDPDTGAAGRDGRIASVSYSLDTDTADVSIDNTSNNFEALLARLALFSGGGAV